MGGAGAVDGCFPIGAAAGLARTRGCADRGLPDHPRSGRLGGVAKTRGSPGLADFTGAREHPQGGFVARTPAEGLSRTRLAMLGDVSTRVRNPNRLALIIRNSTLNARKDCTMTRSLMRSELWASPDFLLIRTLFDKLYAVTESSQSRSSHMARRMSKEVTARLHPSARRQPTVFSPHPTRASYQLSAVSHTPECLPLLRPLCISSHEDTPLPLSMSTDIDHCPGGQCTPTPQDTDCPPNMACQSKYRDLDATHLRQPHRPAAQCTRSSPSPSTNRRCDNRPPPEPPKGQP